jgi:hypothetical protein
MARLDEVFVVDDVPPSERSFDPLPDGWYTAHISAAEVRETKAGTGHYVKLRYDIIGPTHQGRVVFGNFNMRNPNPQAEKIGRQQFAEMCLSIGFKTLDDTDHLIGNTLQIKLTTRQQEGYEPTNEVRAWRAVEGGSMPKPAQSKPQALSIGSSPTPPWAKK